MPHRRQRGGAMGVRRLPHDPTLPIHTDQKGEEGGAPMPGIVTIVALTGVLVLSVARIGWAHERWVLWQEEFRPAGEHRWRPVGTDPGERECEALKRHILAQMSREP